MGTVEIVVVTVRRKALLEKCVERMLGWRDVKITVIVNGYDEETVRFLEVKTRSCPSLKYSVIAEEVPKSAARNQGLAAATSDIIYFLDDDAYPAGANSEIVARIFKDNPDIHVVGGPNLTPDGSPFFQRMAGYALSSLFVSWRMRNRYLRDGVNVCCDDRSLILCNLAIRRDVLVKEDIVFDARLEYNEENLLLQILHKKGHRMMYAPELVVYHSRRGTALSFARQVYKSGEGRGIMTLLLPSSFSPVHAMPTLFIGYLLALPLFWHTGALVVLALYFFGSLCNAVASIIKHRDNPLGIVPLFFLPSVAHIAYGTGFVWGLWKEMKRKK